MQIVIDSVETVHPQSSNPEAPMTVFPVHGHAAESLRIFTDAPGQILEGNPPPFPTYGIVPQTFWSEEHSHPYWIYGSVAGIPEGAPFPAGVHVMLATQWCGGGEDWPPADPPALENVHVLVLA